jgi:uncharacterized protein YjeT (DUF2065 family)
MSDLLVAIGLLFAIEGLLFAAFPATTKRAMESVMTAPDGSLRIIGLVSALLGVMLVWLVRG